MAIALSDENGRDVQVTTTDNADNTFTVEFEPTTVGRLFSKVFFGDEEIPSSPYAISVLPSVDVSGIRVKNLDKRKICFQSS